MPSYEAINFYLRPAKHVERRMLAATFMRLREFGSVEAYRYVGLGSVNFSDFVLFHRTLGITSMLSIEKDVAKRERFEFNRPLGNIELRFGTTTTVLPTLTWNQRSIVWLDYDDPIQGSMLEDIDCVCTSVAPGSILLVTMNAEPGSGSDDRVARLDAAIGTENLPTAGINQLELAGWGTAAAYRRIIDTRIRRVLLDRSAADSPESKLQYQQLFNFQYQDDARMVSVGGVIFDAGQRPIVAKCSFEDLPFVCDADEPYRLDVPSLTHREMRHLDQQLPCDPTVLHGPGIPISQLRSYSRTYRYAPFFVDADP